MNIYHTFTIELSSQWGPDQREQFIKNIIKPLMKECASNWPSTKIIETKKDERL